MKTYFTVQEYEMSSKPVSLEYLGCWSSTLVHTYDGAICWTDVVHILQIIDEERDNGKTAKTKPQGE